ncbi:MAG: STAS domain-containing protein [Paracoccaceae bacterium]
MQLTAEQFPDATLITVLESRIDAASAIAFKDQMRDLTDDGPERVVLDLAGVDFVDSSGLGAIVATMKLLGPERRLEIAALSPTVEKVFRLTRMDSVFTIHESAKMAVGKQTLAS